MENKKVSYIFMNFASKFAQFNIFFDDLFYIYFDGFED
jgi:hypothetical protein